MPLISLCYQPHLFTEHSYWGISNLSLSSPSSASSHHHHGCDYFKVQFSSVVQSCPTLCDPMNCSTPGLPAAAAATAKSLQSCPTLWDLIDGSPSGFPVPGILQARILEWVAISLSNAWKWKVKVKSLSRVWFLATPWTAAYQALPSMRFSRQMYWSGVSLPSPISGHRKALFKFPCYIISLKYSFHLLFRTISFLLFRINFIEVHLYQNYMSWNGICLSYLISL